MIKFGTQGGNRLVTFGIESTGDQLFDLSKGTRSQGEIVPLLHRVAANTANLSARMAQEAVVERMGQIFNIRYKSSSSRFPSFIQQQVKIAKFARTKDFPNITAVLEIQPQAKSSRSNNPLILDTLALGTTRYPFKGKRWAWPDPDETREGGNFAGKVKPQYKWVNLRLGQGKLPKRMSKARKQREQPITESSTNVVYGRRGIIMVRSKKDPRYSSIWEVKKDQAPKRLYSIGPPRQMRKMFDFFETAINAIKYSAQDIFSSLVANKGNDKALSGMFKFGKSGDEIPF